ncbi:MAG: DUF4388 domain-containing protein, partial [Actinomycetes bacterium]
MKLEGSLDAFSLPDVFQLLSFTKKTGGLHLAATGNDGVVFFAGGQVTGASADGSRQPLARRLIGGGAVDDDALAQAVARATAEGVGVVKALLDAGAVDAGLLRRVVTDQAVDAVFDLLRWTNGDFAFVMDEANVDDVGVALPAETVLADAEGRREAWEAVSQAIPSPQSVLGMPVALTDAPEVSKDEWSLLALVDGRRTVAELVDLTGTGQYVVVSTLAALVERGLLEVAGTDETAADHVAVIQRRLQLLSPLEGEPFTPVAETTADKEPARPAVRKAAREAPAHVEVSADAPAEGSAPPPADSPAAPEETVELVDATMLGGAHVPGDVVPPRAEPFLPKRQVDFDETVSSPMAGSPTRPTSFAGQGPAAGGPGSVVGATAV